MGTSHRADLLHQLIHLHVFQKNKITRKKFDQPAPESGRYGLFHQHFWL